MTRRVYGWTFEQWRIAAAEFGAPFSTRDFAVAACNLSEPVPGLQVKWFERHVYDPGQSPIIVVEKSRARATC